jgi:hypothetical protein
MAAASAGTRAQVIVCVLVNRVCLIMLVVVVVVLVVEQVTHNERHTLALVAAATSDCPTVVRDEARCRHINGVRLAINIDLHTIN